MLAIAVTGALGIGLTNGMIAVGIVMFPALARIVRARTLIVRQELYVDASRCFGAPAWHILWKHVLPNALQPVIVQVTLLLAAALLAEASLSFLGLGIQPPNPSWGAMLARAYQYMEIAPEQMYAPGLAILVVSFGIQCTRRIPAHRARSDHARSLGILMICRIKDSASLTSPRLRGEVEICAKHEFRVRGILHLRVRGELPLTRSLRFATASTSPRKRGEVNRPHR